MIARINRFHGHGGVKKVYRLGSPTRSAMFSIHVLSNNKIKTSKATVVVSKKVHKSAVKRNRIRRRIYEIIRLSFSDFKKPSEIIITVYSPEVSDIPHDELDKNVKSILKKSHTI